MPFRLPARALFSLPILALAAVLSCGSSKSAPPAEAGSGACHAMGSACAGSDLCCGADAASGIPACVDGRCSVVLDYGQPCTTSASCYSGACGPGDPNDAGMEPGNVCIFTCPSEKTDDSCISCLKETCCNLFSECGLDVACDTGLNCIDSCFLRNYGNPQAAGECDQGCETQYPSTLGGKLYACAVPACDNACAQ
jgi:hypothetical protein